GAAEKDDYIPKDVNRTDVPHVSVGKLVTASSEASRWSCSRCAVVAEDEPGHVRDRVSGFSVAVRDMGRLGVDADGYKVKRAIAGFVTDLYFFFRGSCT